MTNETMAYRRISVRVQPLLRALRNGLAIVAAVGSLAGVAAASTVTVTNTNDAGAGSLRQAILAANPGDTIQFNLPAHSTITLTSGELALPKGVTIVGPGAANLTISGNSVSRIFNATAIAPIAISGLTLTSGVAAGIAGQGGAILVNSSVGTTPFQLTDVVISNSLAGSTGGGLARLGGSVTITRSSIVNNTSLGYVGGGGGIANLFFGAGAMVIVNSTIAGNTVGNLSFGGGIVTTDPLTLTNCTIFGNTANQGGNLYVAASATTLQNTIVAGGVGAGGGPDIFGAVNSLDYNLIQNTTGATISGATAHNITGVSPLLGSLAGSPPVMAPLAGSPAVDAGSLAAGVTVDQLGLPRPVDLGAYTNAVGGNGSDIGAVEVQAGLTSGIATKPQGGLLIVNGAGNAIGVYRPDYVRQFAFGSVGSGNGQFRGPAGIAVAPNGYIYVTDSGNSRIDVFDANANFRFHFGGPGSGRGQLQNPTGIALSSSGMLFVADTGNNRIEVFDTNGNYLNQFGSAGNGKGALIGPTGIALLPGGKVAVSDTGNNRVQVLDSSGKFLFQFGAAGSGPGQFRQPGGLALTANYLLVADTGNNRIEAFDLGGTFRFQFGSTGGGKGQFNGPTSMVIEPGTGNLLVLDAGNNRVEVFDGNFVYRTQFAIGINPG